MPKATGAIVGIVLILQAWEPVSARSRQEAANAVAASGFIDMVFNRHRVEEAFDRYVGADYIQHNPRVATGRANGIQALGRLVARFPQMRVSVARILADGDLVAIHTHQVKQPGERGSAIAEFFRFARGRIVEHWDVIEEVPGPAEAKNGNGMF
ncbi:nuclear transport factor 2 family protein [Sphingomonas sp.]|uniref:nuclear transport factor 2 family protein n=1 Tax=Sphingomonas sp. TaxID=28214 RepID=UPI000DB6DB2D|nr:nuclear transport factor 2 family protein [Sphingomonas sp.]PZU10977.1 MAG: hypothetical protein DI605_05060 [Sphingomonas sp.]